MHKINLSLLALGLGLAIGCKTVPVAMNSASSNTLAQCSSYEQKVTQITANLASACQTLDIPACSAQIKLATDYSQKQPLTNLLQVQAKKSCQDYKNWRDCNLWSVLLNQSYPEANQALFDTTLLPCQKGNFTACEYRLRAARLLNSPSLEEIQSQIFTQAKTACLRDTSEAAMHGCYVWNSLENKIDQENIILAQAKKACDARQLNGCDLAALIYGKRVAQNDSSTEPQPVKVEWNQFNTITYVPVLRSSCQQGQGSSEACELLKDKLIKTSEAIAAESGYALSLKNECLSTRHKLRSCLDWLTVTADHQDNAPADINLIVTKLMQECGAAQQNSEICGDFAVYLKRDLVPQCFVR